MIHLYLAYCPACKGTPITLHKHLLATENQYQEHGFAIIRELSNKYEAYNNDQ
jgi:hypothetical protein